MTRYIDVNSEENIIKINEITSGIAERIQKRIDNTERENIEIAIR